MYGGNNIYKRILSPLNIEDITGLTGC